MKNILIIIGILLPALCYTQISFNYSKVDYSVESGIHTRTSNKDEQNMVTVFETQIKVNDAHRVRVVIDDYYLGDSSLIYITSMTDLNYQVFNSQSLSEWRGKSAIFNGGAVNIKLVKHHLDNKIYFSISQMIIGEADNIKFRRICDGVDDRVSSNDDRVARMPLTPLNIKFPINCSVSLLNHGAIISAGHCIDLDDNGSIDSGVDLIEFNVPASNSSGVPQASHPNDQYPITLSSIEWGYNDGLYGRDWAVFKCGENSNTGLTPHQAQGDFFRTSLEFPEFGDNLKNIGYGHDSNDPTRSRAQQEGIGSLEYIYLNTNDPKDFRHRIDTEGGSSGSPILRTDEEFVIGIHTNGLCDQFGSPQWDNYGTPLNFDDFEDSLNDFLGTNTTYVDKVSLAPTELGTLFAPFDTVQEGVNSATGIGLLYITPGTYNSGSISINKAIKIIEPVTGVVKINP